MPKKQKHPRLPNGYGQIRLIDRNRYLPYAVHPPATERNDKGNYIRPPALCYVPDWYTGFAVLAAYHAGTYKPGLELDLAYDRHDINAFCRRVLSQNAYQMHSGILLSDAYHSFIDFKFGANAPKLLSQSARNAYEHGWKYLSPLKDRPLSSIGITDLQTIINKCQLKQATKENIKLTAKAIYKYALQHELCEKDPTKYLVIPAGGEDEHGVPLSDAELTTVWKHAGENAANLILIMCYSGFRVGALASLEVNSEEWYFKGGIKTAAGKGRIVPIHSGIRQLVDTKRPAGDAARKIIKEFFSLYGMDHTPHDCRHTFSALCERYGVSEADRKRMMGHSFGADITNSIYGHRTLDDLRAEIEKIKILFI